MFTLPVANNCLILINKLIIRFDYFTMQLSNIVTLPHSYFAFHTSPRSGIDLILLLLAFPHKISSNFQYFPSEKILSKNVQIKKIKNCNI